MSEGQIYVKLSEDKLIPKSDVLSLLRTYNCYHEGKNFQLRTREICSSDRQMILRQMMGGHEVDLLSPDLAYSGKFPTVIDM
ncbi:Ras association domain-containing protein 4 [Takifugu flavidus]|uniref:Ras association domain-containing protein 4 n=1 Tax=Takifugu flavidus TaxID=433684 RepID=A0A5C6PH55_9TELE|nr:Ras association domain-containing protein 4 [Takifugu flavidus]